MENQENKETKKNCSCKQDAKTFLIALLTSVIVVALYHFGCGLCRIYCPESCGEEEIPVCRKYVLVPVQSLPPCDFGGPCAGAKKFRHHGEFRGDRKMMRQDMKRPGMAQPNGKRPPMPEKPAPAPAAE